MKERTKINATYILQLCCIFIAGVVLISGYVHFFVEPNDCKHDNGYLMRPHPVTLERRVGATVELICDIYCLECDMLLQAAEEDDLNESRTVSSTNFYKDGVLIWHCPGEGNISGQEGSYIKELIYPDGTTRLVVDDNWQFGTTGKENQETMARTIVALEADVQALETHDPNSLILKLCPHCKPGIVPICIPNQYQICQEHPNDPNEVK